MAEEQVSAIAFNDEVNELIDIVFEDYDFINDFRHHMEKGESVLSFNRKTLSKTIDETWISTIEQSLGSIDHVIRNPGKDIKEEEEILPIELTRKVTSRSIKHLTQHTNFINSIDRNGNVMPSKILNVYKEENYLTYENKFVNTLLDRLYIFLYKRMDQLEKHAGDEFSSEMKLDLDFSNNDTEISVGLSITAKDKKNYSKKDTSSDANEGQKSGEELVERAKRLMKIVSGFKSSDFAAKLGNNYVHPPIMRTNAIMKNQYLKQCLVLWQFIESYDKLGFDISAKETAEKPPSEIMKSIYSLLAMQYMLFRQSTTEDPEANLVKKTRRTSRPVTPRIVKDFSDEFVEDYNYYEVENKKILAVFPGKSNRKLSKDEMNIRIEVDRALSTEKRYDAAQKTKAKK